MRVIEHILCIDTKRRTNLTSRELTCKAEICFISVRAKIIECIIQMEALQGLDVSVRFKQTFVLKVFVLT